MILIYVIIILVLVQNGQRENCFDYNDSSQVAVKPAIDLSGSVPPRYSLLQPVQLLYNNYGPFKINFKRIDNENVYNSLRDFSLRLFKLPYYLERNVLGTMLVVLLVILTVTLNKYKLSSNHRRKYKKLKSNLNTLTKKFEEQHKVIGRQDRFISQQHERIIRLSIEKMKDFGSDFAQGVKITSLKEAVQHIFGRCGKNVEDQHVIIECSKIRDLLRPSDGANNSDYVTGIQRDLLIWYLEGVRRYRLKSPSELEDKLRRFPWVGEDGKLSLVNVRKCIRFVHKDLKQTLAFLAQTIDWDDLNSFISPRPKKGKAKGHGLYFLMHHLYASHCKATSATAHNPQSLFSFPPPGEIEIDAQGRIETGPGTIKIKMGEIKISKEKIPEAKKQLKRSLVFFAGLHKLIAVNDDVSPCVSPICYDLIGYIFISGGTNVTKNEVLPLPPLGKISYLIFNS